ncbi:TerB family tellurite resistance protein [Cyanobium sp. CH-040]|uniref:tellurite resistance TerB family protein n=1 Tax=Cyanobium sp. CH-040 TaxID=2823708 RepID=UPI0020CE8873|nr:TerB family tellurite resistance protein [Cyanobium sp. CH-040]MCP9926267.1 TerB family tellurite resistance protein [Cyanobium sp. CH-040]
MDAELALFRIGATVAWADGELSEEERQRLSQAIARAGRHDADHQRQLDQTLSTANPASLPVEGLDALVAALTTPEQRQRALQLAYGVIRSSRRSGDHGSINVRERLAYGRLLRLLQLDPDLVASLEGDVEVELARSAGTPVGLLAGQFAGLIGWG